MAVIRSERVVCDLCGETVKGKAFSALIVLNRRRRLLDLCAACESDLSEKGLPVPLPLGAAYLAEQAKHLKP